MKKIMTSLLTAAMALSLCACGDTESSSSSESSAETTTAETTTVEATTEEVTETSETEPEELSAPDQLLEDIRGTYDPLFPVICDAEYDQIWLDRCEAIVGADMAESYTEILKSSCTGELYGEEAVEAYTDPESIQFYCGYTEDVAQFVFDGNDISGLDADGNILFEHSYTYVKDLSLGGMMDGYLYETDDEDAGEFRYFFMMPDTPATTYHIEFRYGSDEDALAEYAEGKYAYWLAAGILTDRDEQMIDDVITLFVEENLSDMDEEEEAEEDTDAETPEEETEGEAEETTEEATDEAA